MDWKPPLEQPPCGKPMPAFAVTGVPAGSGVLAGAVVVGAGVLAGAEVVGSGVVVGDPSAGVEGVGVGAGVVATGSGTGGITDSCVLPTMNPST